MKVIAFKHLPKRLPIGGTFLYWLLLDHLHVQAWVWGVAGTLAAIIWASCIYWVCIQEDVELKEMSEKGAT